MNKLINYTIGLFTISLTLLPTSAYSQSKFYERMKEIGEVLSVYEVASAMCEVSIEHPQMPVERKLDLVLAKIDEEAKALYIKTDRDYVQILLAEYINENCLEAYRNSIWKN